MASNAQSKLLQEAAQRYAQQITPETLVALAERGISELVAGAYQIGTIVEPINGHEMYEGWISIPYITVNGSCVGFKFRRPDDGKPKYGSPTGQKAHLYNVTDITISSKHIVITEGELDAVITSGVLGIPAVGVPGVAAWKSHFPKLFSGYETVFVVGDNDVKEDGSNPGQELARRLQDAIPQAVRVSLPPDSDVNSIIVNQGAQALADLVNAINN